VAPFDGFGIGNRRILAAHEFAFRGRVGDGVGKKWLSN
jgi:hypothetical protein